MINEIIADHELAYVPPTSRHVTICRFHVQFSNVELKNIYKHRLNSLNSLLHDTTKQIVMAQLSFVSMNKKI